MQITTFRMIYLTFVNGYDPWPGATTFRTFQLPELIADTLTAGRFFKGFGEETAPMEKSNFGYHTPI